MTPLRRRLPLLLAVLCGLVAGRAAAADYRLGPQDILQVRVYDLRAGTGQAYQWPAFEGTYTVGASGEVSLPLLGGVAAAGRTTAELEAVIALKLQSRVGLAERPDASVQVTKYRPFYVAGSVDKAGEYEFRPGLTVLQAVSIAGGTSRSTTDALLGYARDALSARGELRVLVQDRLALLARQARLDAEIQNADKVTVPPEVQAHISDPDVARLVREEQLLFEARNYALRSQTESLQQSKVVLAQQIDSLNAKDASLAHQLDVIKKELDQVSSLVAKGLAVLPRQLAIEQNTAQFESDRLDVQLNILRAKQDIAKADRDILELGNTKRNQSLQEATEVRGKLAETVEKIDTAQALVDNAELRAPAAIQADADGAARPDYLITRVVNGTAQTRPAAEGDPVEPGDVVRVMPRRTAAGVAAGGRAPAALN